MRAKGLSRPIRTRIVAGAVILTLIGVLIATVFIYQAYRDGMARLIVQRDRELSLLTAVRLRDELAKLARELDPVVRSQSVYLGLTEKQRLLLRGQGGRLGVFDGGLVLMDITGRVRASAPERWDIMSHDWSNEEFFRTMLVTAPPSEYFSSVADVGPDNTPVVVVSVPVLGPNGEMTGVLAGMFRLAAAQGSTFYASIVRLRLSGTGDSYIVDGAGRVIYDSGYRRTGQTMDIAALRAAGSTSELKPTLNAAGAAVIVAHAPVPGTSWTLITETDWAQAMAPVERFASTIIALLALGLVVPTIGVALLARGQRGAISENDQAALEARTGKAMRQRLLPPYTPMLGGWEVAVHHQSAANGATARDLYDYMLLPDGRLMIALATVAERGLAAVHLLTTARATFRTVACSTASAGRALSICNNLLCPDTGPDTAMTSLFALLDPASGRLQVANAGFCAPFRWSAGDLIEMREGADFLGQAPDIEFDHDEVLLGPGDAMLFYSPGALGIRPETGEPFGPERVRRVLNASGAGGAQAMIDALKTDLAEFADADSLHRVDLTFIALSRSPSARGSEKPRRSLRDELRALGETETDL